MADTYERMAGRCARIASLAIVACLAFLAPAATAQGVADFGGKGMPDVARPQPTGVLHFDLGPGMELQTMPFLPMPDQDQAIPGESMWFQPCTSPAELAPPPPPLRFLKLHVLKSFEVRPRGFHGPMMGPMPDNLTLELYFGGIDDGFAPPTKDYFEDPFAGFLQPRHHHMRPPQGSSCDRGAPTGGNAAPWASGQATLLDACDATVRFEASPSTDSDGMVVRWDWDFGDDSGGGTGPVLEHKFAGPGVYNVGLHVYDDMGASSQAALRIRVPVCGGPDITTQRSAGKFTPAEPVAVPQEPAAQPADAGKEPVGTRPPLPPMGWANYG